MCRMPFVFLELKGAAYNTDAIDWLWAEVLELGLVSHVALYVMDDEQPSMLRQQTHWQGLLMRGFRVQHPSCSLAAHSVCCLSVRVYCLRTMHHKAQWIDKYKCSKATCSTIQPSTHDQLR